MDDMTGSGYRRFVGFYLPILMFLISTIPAYAGLINFDKLSSGQDVGNNYSASGVHFSPGGFTVLTEKQSLVSGAFSPSYPNVAYLLPSKEAITFDSPQSTVSFTYGIITAGLRVAASGPSFSESRIYTKPSYPKIDEYAEFFTLQPSITSLTFSQATGDTVIDNLVFSSTSGLHRAKNRMMLGLEVAGGVAAVGLSAASFGLAPLTLTTSSVLSAGALVISLGLEGMAIKNFHDPFDPNYQKKDVPVFHQLPLIAADATFPQPLADEANNVLNHGSRAVSFLQALYVSLNRQSSAIHAGDQSSTDLQNLAVDMDLALGSAEIDQYARGLQSLSTELANSNLDISFTQQDVANFLDDLKAGGFAALPPGEQSLFNLFGFDSAFKQGVVNNLLSVDPSNVPLSLSQALSSDATGFQDLASVYAGPSAASSTTTVPEPSTPLLIGAGLLALWLRRDELGRLL